MRTVALGLFPLITGFPAWADDPLVDITLTTNGDGDLEVRLRPDGPFDGIVSTLLFTIRWDAASEVNLGSIDQPDPAISYIPIVKSDAEIDADGYRYQTFSGIGFTPLQWIPTEWTAGEEYLVAVVDVPSGTSEFAIVNDGWTDANNASYFVSLNGYDRTGIIYADPTTGVRAGTLPGLTMEVLPNPAEGHATVTIASDHAQDLQLDLLDAAGQHVWHRSLTKFDGIRRETLDLDGVASGVYMLRLRGGEQVLLRRLVKR